MEMNNELTTTPSQSLVSTHDNELQVSAFTPQEMLDANQSLIRWCDRKIMSMRAEATELLEAFNQAVEKKWKSSTLKRHADIAEKRVSFYEKIKDALKQGYYIVPNFPIDVFAIRTKKDKPRRCLTIGTYEPSSWNLKQSPQLLPTGEGDYKPSTPLSTTEKDITKEGNNTKTTFFKEATEWGDVEFPIQMAKPTIMEAVSRAMAFKIFDQIGLLAQGTGDPVIVGEIVDPRSVNIRHNQNSKRVTFIIAWHLDTRTI